ncbi:hypothetical protein [Cytophaga aurantiaca]|uniref:hypothetical protein n=1 Tax=Cytophaga aurantiaca TaxID=29530 RepID=UPI000377F0CB|nr:hypothetical protein [Cytophaga aurantiaca]
MKIGFLCFVFLFFLNGCSKPDTFEKEVRIKDDFFDGFVSLKKMESIQKYQLSISDTARQPIDCIYTPYDVFQMETGDVNRDGKTDICLGIIKPTPFDSILKKRLFIFQIDRAYIRPLWLSSRLVNPLEEFSVKKDSLQEIIIRTIERTSPETFCTRSYKWGSFGMMYLSTEQDSINYENAKQQLYR